MHSTIVLDAGSSSVKAGLSASTAPLTFPSLAGRAKYKPLFRPSPHVDINNNNNDMMMSVGHTAAERRGLLHLTYPIQHGTIVDWDAWHPLLLQVETKLENSFADKNIFWVEHPFSSRPQRARVAEIMFEEKAAAGMSAGIAPLLSLYATGNTTGVVLDVGEGVASVAAAVAGFAMTKMMQREDFGGGDVTQYLQKLLREYGSYNTYSYNNNNNSNNNNVDEKSAAAAAAVVRRCFNPSRCGAERELVRGIKEQCCEVSPHSLPTGSTCYNNNNNNDGPLLNLTHAISTSASSSSLLKNKKIYSLPDGTELTLGYEVLEAPEVLFNPSLIGKENTGLAGIVSTAIQAADVELRAELCKHVYITGGTTLLNGFGQRFLSELLELTPRSCKVRVSAPAERFYSAWLGGCFLSRLSTYTQQMVVSRAEYMEEGERALHSRLVG